MKYVDQLHIEKWSIFRVVKIYANRSTIRVYVIFWIVIWLYWSDSLSENIWINGSYAFLWFLYAWVAYFTWKFFSITGYIGCFKDNKLPAMPYKHIINNRMTIETCTKHCRSKGYYYAGVEVTMYFPLKERNIGFSCLSILKFVQVLSASDIY